MGVVARMFACGGVGGALLLSLVLSGTPASAQSALLDALSRRVTLAHADGSAGEVAADQIIRSGDTVSTDETGRAVVTYPDGSTALLEENSALTIEFARTSAGDYVVRMQQTLGRVWYAITRAVILGSRYEVRSAGMASVVRAGSDSYVTVSPSGETTVVTISGIVDTSAGGVEVSVSAGSSTTVSEPGATPRASTPTANTASPNTPAPSTPPPSTPAPTTPAPTTGQAPTPSPSGFVPPIATLPPLPTFAPEKPRTTTPSVPIPTPKPTAAPTPGSTPREKDLKDRFGPRNDAPGQPPPTMDLT